MFGEDVIVALGDDLASKRGFAWDVDASVVLQESSFTRHSSLVVEGGFDPLIPQFLLSSGVLDFGMYFIGRGHNKCLEMRRLKDNDISIVILPLIMVVAL